MSVSQPVSHKQPANFCLLHFASEEKSENTRKKAAGVHDPLTSMEDTSKVPRQSIPLGVSTTASLSNMQSTEVIAHMEVKNAVVGSQFCVTMDAIQAALVRAVLTVISQV